MLLRKGVYPYEYKDCWQTSDETSLQDKEAFYSSLNIEFLQTLIIDMQKDLLKYFNDKNVGDYHELYVQTDTLLLANVFEKSKISVLK